MNLNVESKEVKTLIENKNIAAITLTGSDPTGRSVASIATKLKKTVMELGGSDAYIILDDVDLEEATDLATLDDYKTMDKPVFAKRFIVHDAIYDAF
jgi:succinate-semialdehyde dehydrogenase/glutarate-semialdehyde dehydrogenase